MIRELETMVRLLDPKRLFRAMRDSFSLFRESKMALVGLGITGFFVVIGMFAPLIAPYRPGSIEFEPFIPPSGAHIMGTDDLGRDVFSRVIFGSRISMVVGVFAGLTSLVIGVIVGLASGYLGGKADMLLMRFVEVVQVIPRFFLVIMLVVIFGPSIMNIIIAIGILGWPSTARIVRAEVLSTKELPFVEAARLMGLSDIRIMLSEILPNTITSAIVNTALLSAAAIISEAGLSFLGLGDPNMFSLGLLLQQSYRFLVRAWWAAVFPGVFVSLMVLGLNLLTDGVSAAVNPQKRPRA